MDPNAYLDQLATALQRAQEERGRRVAWVSGELAHVGVSNQQLEADMLAAHRSWRDRDRLPAAIRHGGRPADRRRGAGSLATSADRAARRQYAVHACRAHGSCRPACRAISPNGRWHWQANGPSELRLSLNVTPADLAAASFPDRISAHWSAARGFPPERLTIEITEQVLLADLEEITRALNPLKTRRA